MKHTHTLGRTPLDEGSVRRRDPSQHTTLRRDIHPRYRRDSKPLPQKADGRRPPLYTGWPKGVFKKLRKATISFVTCPSVCVCLSIRKEQQLGSHFMDLKDILYFIQNWLQKWKIKVNETNSSHITFTLRKDNFPAIRINQTFLPRVESVKYLGLHFDRRLNWKAHINKKRKQTDLKAKEINWLTGRKSNLSIENKLLVYKR